MRRGVDRGDGNGPCRPAGVRPTRTATADRHRTSCARLSLRCLRYADTSGVSRGRRRASAVRQADQRRGAVSAALPVAPRETSGRADGRPFRGQAGHRDHRQDQPGLCRTLPALRRCVTRPGGCGAGQAHGRDRLPNWRQDAVAAYRLDRLAHLLPHCSEAVCWQTSPALSCTTTGSPTTR